MDFYLLPFFVLFFIVIIYFVLQNHSARKDILQFLEDGDYGKALHLSVSTGSWQEIIKTIAIAESNFLMMNSESIARLIGALYASGLTVSAKIFLERTEKERGDYVEVVNFLSKKSLS